MAGHTRPTFPVLMLASALLPASFATSAQPQRDIEQPGVSGYVLAPDGTPVSDGRVTMVLPGAAGSSSPIERTGRFRLVPNMPGVYQLSVSVPGLAPKIGCKIHEAHVYYVDGIKPLSAVACSLLS